MRTLTGPPTTHSDVTVVTVGLCMYYEWGTGCDGGHTDSKWGDLVTSVTPTPTPLPNVTMVT